MFKNRKLLICIPLSFFICMMANGVWSISIFAWIYAASFLLQFSEIIGMDLWICAAASVILAAIKILPYLCWMKSKKDFRDAAVFAAAMVMAEYVIYLVYPILGGLSDAYTQYRNSYLLQLVTITGVYGITFLMYWTAAVLLWVWKNKEHLFRLKKYIFVYCTVIGLVFLYGVILFQSGDNAENSVRMAGVTVPVSHLLNEDKDVYAVFYTDTFTEENRRRAKIKLSEVTAQLFTKSEQEAEAGAKLVFWSELNGAILKEDEAALLKKASEMAKNQDIYFLVSLLVKTPYEDYKENKVVAFNPRGEIISEYFKSGLSIGELCQKGDGRLQSFDSAYGRIAPFICSDMASISMIRQAGKANIDILTVPSSDWEKMTDIAVKNAVVRGVENGCSVIRHTNKGKSVVSDSRGNILALTDYFQSDTKTIAAQVPTTGRFTLYSRIGNLFIYLCGIRLLCALWGAAGRN